MSAAGLLLCEKYRCRMHAPPTTEESWSYGRSLLTAKYKEQTNKLKYQNLLKSTRKERNFEFPNSDQKQAMQSTSCTAANHEKKVERPKVITLRRDWQSLSLPFSVYLCSTWFCCARWLRTKGMNDLRSKNRKNAFETHTSLKTDWIFVHIKRTAQQFTFKFIQWVWKKKSVPFYWIFFFLRRNQYNRDRDLSC